MAEKTELDIKEAVSDFINQDAVQEKFLGGANLTELLEDFVRFLQK